MCLARSSRFRCPGSTPMVAERRSGFYTVLVSLCFAVAHIVTTSIRNRTQAQKVSAFS